MASVDLERLVVQLSADIKRFENGFNKATGIADKGFKRIENRAKTLDTRLSTIGLGLGRGLTAAFAAVGGGAAFMSLSDSFTAIENSLKVAGLEGAALDKVFNDLYNSAKRNSVPVKDLASLFSAVSLAQNELGVSTQQITGFTDTIGLALKVSGKSAQEASGALLQLGQALGGGVVRAEEFNSLIEGAPAILLAAAGGLKEAEGSVSKLRKIMLDGKLSSEAFFAAIEAGRPILEDKVANATETLGQKFINLQNDLIKVVGEFNKTYEAAGTLGEGIDGLASIINSQSFEQFIDEVAKIGTAFKTALAEARGFIAGLPTFSGDANSMLDALSNEGGITAGTGPGGAAGRSGFQVVQDKFDKFTQEQMAQREKILNEIYADPTKYGPQRAGQTVPNFEVPGRFNPLKGLPGDLKYKPVVKPVSLSDYDVPGDDNKKKGKKAKKTGEEKFGESLQEARQRLDNLKEETALQAQLNPLVNDYGEQVASLKFKQDLLNDAKKNGVEVTPELMATIDGLAGAYGQASAEADKLAESQKKVKENAEEFGALAKDVTRGFVDGFIEGKSAAELFADALSKIGNKLLDLAFNSVFDSKPGGGGGIFAGLGKLLGFASGGYTGQGGKHDPAGIVHKGEYVVPKSTVDKLGVSGVENALTGRGLSVIPRASSNGGGSFTFAPQIDNRGASVETVARTEAMLNKLNAEFEGRVTNQIRRNNRSNVKTR